MLRKRIATTWEFVRRDHLEWPARFWLEVLAWALSISAAVLFALTVPQVPFFVYLVMVITGSAIYTWAAWTRGSFGMLANYLLLVVIDVVGLVRLLT